MSNRLDSDKIRKIEQLEDSLQNGIMIPITPFELPSFIFPLYLEKINVDKCSFQGYESIMLVCLVESRIDWISNVRNC